MAQPFLFLQLLTLPIVLGSPLKKCPERYQIDPAITRFRRYIQIDTSKEENLNRAVEFWRQQAVELGLPFVVFRPGGMPVCIITVLGSDPSLPSIMLNSHMDVVPAIESEWKYPPFSAYMDENGDIYGRGSQDAKDVSSQYMEAVRRLKKDNVMLKRNLHITLMPDEETGGFKGMKEFVKTEAFKAMNVGFALDEGLVSSDDTLLVSYQDRRPWQMQVTVHGAAGHGSGMPDDSAMEKARKFINLVHNYRDQMKSVMRSVDPFDYGGFTSINMNIITAGYKPNIIPSEFLMVVDMRLSTESNATEVEQMVNSWVSEAGSGTELKFIRRDDVSEKTVLDDSNPYWVAMRSALREINFKVVPILCPGTTDMLVLRNLGIPALGFSPKTFTQIRAHGTDEFLNADVFLQGIDVFYAVLKNLGNLPCF